MFRKIVWSYIFTLTLLDCSLKTKLTAQGKSHGVSVQDSLVEGITFQEWGVEESERSGEGGAGAVRLSPPALDFGRASLGAAHALTVSITNTANTTLHLASIAGTTPDFHASFFDAKTLPPDGNTSFSVVYLGRREGPVSAHLYIHTSRGVHKYPVSALGVGSAWGVWPLVSVRVPLNATVSPALRVHNPTARAVQVQEAYSGAAWLALELPCHACRGADWALPPHSARDLLRLHLHAPPLPAITYVRIKADMPGGGLVVGVEASAAPPGEYSDPLHIHPGNYARTDPPLTVEIMMGNSARSARVLSAGVWAAACLPAPHAPPAPPQNTTHHNGGSTTTEGVVVTLLRTTLDPHQELIKTALVTFHFDKLWAESGSASVSLVCAGWITLGAAVLPYSLTLLNGRVAFHPPHLNIITCTGTESLGVTELTVRNEFPEPVELLSLYVPTEVHKLCHVSGFRPQRVEAGGVTSLARVSLRAVTSQHLVSLLTLATNLSTHHLPLRVYHGNITTEWQWPNSSDGTLRLGGIPMASTRRVRLRLHNPAECGPSPGLPPPRTPGLPPPCAVCVTELSVDLPGATIAIENCPPLPHDLDCACVGAGSALWAALRVSGEGEGEGEEEGRVRVRVHTGAGAALRVRVRWMSGRVRAARRERLQAAPHAPGRAALRLHSSAEPMRLLHVSSAHHDPALSYIYPSAEESWEVSEGMNTLGSILYQPELACQPHCYTGLDVNLPEGEQWVQRGAAWSRAALRRDTALYNARRRVWRDHPSPLHNFTMHLHTTQVVQLPVRGSVQLVWPRLEVCEGACGARGAGLAAVGGAGVSVRLHLCNPSSTHALLLQPALHTHGEEDEEESQYCQTEDCSKTGEGAFKLSEWTAAAGGVRVWEAGGGAAGGGGGGDVIMPMLELQPRAELLLTVTFTPTNALAMSTNLYLRNNLTILETISLTGEGAFPSFEINGRKPGDPEPILIEVTEVSEGTATARVPLWVRNTGGVALELRGWRVAGRPCVSRGLALAPCQPLRLAPGARHQLALAFTADCTLAAVHATLHVACPAGPAAFKLRATVPAPLLPRCGANRFRPSFDGAVRGAFVTLAVLALVLALAVAALDAERALRRARAACSPSSPAPLAPLDLRAAAAASAPRPPRRRRPARRLPPPQADPSDERRAFERWRDSVLRRGEPDASEGGDAEDDRSSSDADLAAPPPDPTPPEDDDTGDDEPPVEDEPPEEEAPPGPDVAPAVRPDVPPDSTPALTPAELEAAAAGKAARGGGATPAPRRRARAEPGERRPHVRRERAVKRRSLPPPATAAAARAPVPAPDASECGAPAEGSPGSAGRGGGGGGLRLGASWSSVVAQGSAPTLPPIGSDVRRRVDRSSCDNSLFYFNGDNKEVWCSPPPPLPPSPSAALPLTPPLPNSGALFNTSFGGYPGPEEPAVGSGGYGAVWGGTGSWGWSPPAAVPPPPGFTTRAVSRLYDPFHALSSIWAPGALDWTASNNHENNLDNNNTAPNNTANTNNNNTNGNHNR